MRRTSASSRFAVLAPLLCTLAGCGGCQESPPPPPPPAAVQGILPTVPKPVAAGATIPSQRVCAVLVFANPEEGPAPLQTQLTAEGDCTDGEARVSWDFGDGTPPATGMAVIHTYEKAGTYTARGKITSDALPGVEDSDEIEVLVTAPAS